jgi:hypothetical protein
MEQIGTSAAIALYGAGIGWVALFSGVVAPVSFADLDHGRANRHVRSVIKRGHGALAILVLLGAGAAFMAGSIGGALIGAIAGGVFFLCQWALAPREDSRPPPGGKRKLQTVRIVSAMLTTAMAPVLLVAIGLAAAGI